MRLTCIATADKQCVCNGGPIARAKRLIPESFLRRIMLLPPTDTERRRLLALVTTGS